MATDPSQRLAWFSLRWRLPLLISALIFLVLAAYLGVTYREVTRLQIESAGARSQLAADQLARLLAQSTPQRLREAQRIAENPDVRQCLADRPPEGCEAFVKGVQAAAPPNVPRVVELWNDRGERLAIIGAPSPKQAATHHEAPSRSTLVVGAVRKQGDTLYTETIVEVPTPASSDLPAASSSGFVVVRRQMVASAARELLSQLVGHGAAIKIGNRVGDVWTDLAVAVPAPAVDLGRPGTARYRAPDGRAYVGALSHVTGTSTAVWVEFPEDLVLADARALLRRMASLGLLVLIGASISAWGLSGRITRPMRTLTEQAEAIAAGEYRALTTTRRDEIGRLMIASTKMAARIHSTHQQLERRVAERTAALEAANAELEAFSYSVSHDLRAPLRHIVGFATLLDQAAAPRLQETDRRYLTTISEAASRMGQLIDDLLAFSRTGRTPVSRESVNLMALTDDVRREVTAGVNDRTIAWRIHALPVVQGDSAMLRLVLVNLLSNAVKYSSTRAEAVIEIGTLAPANGEVTVFVRDNGVGFDMQYAHKLFGVFQRLHRAEEFEGTGIGLATVRRIVHRHGGRAWGEGVVNQGATFYFSLPRKENNA
jgi:signal transduction histidine kinase